MLKTADCNYIHESLSQLANVFDPIIRSGVGSKQEQNKLFLLAAVCIAWIVFAPLGTTVFSEHILEPVSVIEAEASRAKQVVRSLMCKTTMPRRARTESLTLCADGEAVAVWLTEPKKNRATLLMKRPQLSTLLKPKKRNLCTLKQPHKRNLSTLKNSSQQQIMSQTGNNLPKPPRMAWYSSIKVARSRQKSLFQMPRRLGTLQQPGRRGTNHK